MNLFRQARDKGGLYLENVQHLDGSFPNHEQGASAYWGMLNALIVTGNSNRANQLCKWIRKNALRSDGDIGSTCDKGLAYPYPISWIVEGAHRIGQFDISQASMNFVMKFWDYQHLMQEIPTIILSGICPVNAYG